MAAVISSISLSALFFLLGCASGWFGRKYKEANSDKNTHTQPTPLYEDVRPTSTSQDQEKGFELKENIVYDPVQYK